MLRIVTLLLSVDHCASNITESNEPTTIITNKLVLLMVYIVVCLACWLLVHRCNSRRLVSKTRYFALTSTRLHCCRAHCIYLRFQPEVLLFRQLYQPLISLSCFISLLRLVYRLSFIQLLNRFIISACLQFGHNIFNFLFVLRFYELTANLYQFSSTELSIGSVVHLVEKLHLQWIPSTMTTSRYQHCADRHYNNVHLEFLC